MFGQGAVQQHRQQKGLFTFYREMHQATQQQQLSQKSIKQMKKSKILSKLNTNKQQLKNHHQKNIKKQTPQKIDNSKSKSQMKTIDKINHRAQFLKHILNHNHQSQKHKARKVLISSKDNLKTQKMEQNPEQQSLYSLRLQQNVRLPIKTQQTKTNNHQEIIKIISKKLQESVKHKYEFQQDQYQIFENESQQAIGLGLQIPLNPMQLKKAKNLNSLSIFVSQGKLTDHHFKYKNHKASKLLNKIQYPTTFSNLGNINDLIIANELKSSEERAKKMESSNPRDSQPITKQSIRFPNLQKKKQLKSGLSKQIQNIKQISIAKLQSDGWKNTKSKYLHTQVTQNSNNKKTKSVKSISKMLPLLLCKQSKTQTNQTKIQKPVASLFFCQYVKEQDYARFNSLSPKKRLLMMRLGYNFNI